jgi:hypothetical protein
MVFSSPSTIERDKTDQAQTRPRDHADLPGPVTPNSSATAHHLGITVTSA